MPCILILCTQPPHRPIRVIFIFKPSRYICHSSSSQPTQFNDLFLIYLVEIFVCFLAIYFTIRETLKNSQENCLFTIFKPKLILYYNSAHFFEMCILTSFIIIITSTPLYSKFWCLKDFSCYVYF